jgi:hypothetical protein
MTVADRGIEEMTPEMRAALRAYPGRWVALTQNPLALLAVGDSPREVYEAAERAGVQTPLLYQVPDDTVQTFYY